MKNTLSIETMAKSKVLPCDLYCDGKVSSHIRKTGLAFKCCLEEDSIVVKHLVQTEASKGTDFTISFHEIDYIDLTLSRVPYGSLYGVRYHITLNLIVNLKNGSNYEIETSAFELLQNICDIFSGNNVTIRDEIGINDIVCGKNKEEIQEYLNKEYEGYIKKYGIKNMRMMNDR